LITFPFDLTIDKDAPKIFIAHRDHIMYRSISNRDDQREFNAWATSDSIAGMRHIAMLEIYFGIMLVVSVTEEGKYIIQRSIDYKKYSVVHTHDVPIDRLIQTGMGNAVFHAIDGWWITTDSGATWALLTANSPDIASCIWIGNISNTDNNVLIAYGKDHKIYNLDYLNSDEWILQLDTNFWTGKWYPAIAGSQLGILAGAGKYLLHSDFFGNYSSWRTKAQVNGIIKNIAISNESLIPVFLITVEQSSNSEQNKFYWTYDLGDSLIPDINRIDPMVAVESVIPTSDNIDETIFVASGRRTNQALNEFNYHVTTIRGP